MATDTRFGIGFDIWPFSDSEKLILAGTEIPDFPGLTGYPDGEILIYTISDSMLGALTLGSFVDLFPENDSRFNKLPPLLQLQKIYDLIRQEGFILNNLDSTLVLHKQINRNYINSIRKNIADILWCDIGKLSIKISASPFPGFPGDTAGITAITITGLLKGKR
ncbi:MAG: 2-C-methyl-D-erythritol 2,4-cyclodiphosphate synthase [Calditrichota bacterium]